MSLNWKEGDVIHHAGSGHDFTVRWCEGDKAVLQSQSDLMFGCVREDAASPEGWDVDHTSAGDYVEFAFLAEAVSYFTHEHTWEEGVDEDGNLIEPAFDVCSSCGAQRD